MNNIYNPLMYRLLNSCSYQISKKMIEIINDCMQLTTYQIYLSLFQTYNYRKL
jgi:hypothetical protein